MSVIVKRQKTGDTKQHRTTKTATRNSSIPQQFVADTLLLSLAWRCRQAVCIPHFGKVLKVRVPKCCCATQLHLPIYINLCIFTVNCCHIIKYSLLACRRAASIFWFRSRAPQNVCFNWIPHTLRDTLHITCVCVFTQRNKSIEKLCKHILL